MKKWIYRLIFGSVCLWFLAGFLAFQHLIRATPHEINQPEVLDAFDTQSIFLTTQDSVRIAGWYIQPRNFTPGNAAVIILACLRGSRLTLIQRARFYLTRGKPVLLIDLRSTGASSGNFTSFGWYEKRDLIAAYDFLFTKGITQIGLHGISVGAATICYALPDLDAIHFIVLESCYDKMSHAVRNRTHSRFGLPVPFFFPVIVFAQLKFGFKFFAMNPIDYLPLVKSPILLIAGNEDPSVLPVETRALYQELLQQKRLWLVPGCGHDDFYQQKPLEYEMHLNSFLKEFHLISGE